MGMRLQVATEEAAKRATLTLRDEREQFLAQNEVEVGATNAALWDGLFATDKWLNTYAEALRREGGVAQEQHLLVRTAAPARAAAAAE